MAARNRWLIAAYWVIAVLCTALGAALGASWGSSQAPTFDNDDKGAVPVTSASHFLYSVFGGVLVALAVLAVFAAVWLGFWVRSRRARKGRDERDDDEPADGERMSIDDVQGLLETEDDPR